MARKQVSENKAVVSTSAAAAPARRPAAASKRTPRAASPAVEVSNAVVAKPQVIAPVAVASPSFEVIARLAYSYWESRGGQGGSSEQDWLRAEQELSGK
jgi:hypothetical protein